MKPNLRLYTTAYLEPCQTSKMERFVKTVNDSMLLTIFAKGTILDVSQGSEYASVYEFNWFIAIVI